MTDTQQQLAASRMLTARLHVALTAAREVVLDKARYDQTSPADKPENDPLVRDIDAALGHNEPEILALLADVDRQAKVARLNSAAKRAVELFQGNVEGMNVAEFIHAMGALQEALLP